MTGEARALASDLLVKWSIQTGATLTPHEMRVIMEQFQAAVDRSERR